MATELKDKLTPCTNKEALEALASAWIALFGNPAPKRESLCVLFGQWAEETAWGRAMHGNNMGNAKSVDGDGRDFAYFACNEVFSRAHAEQCVAAAKPRTDNPSKRDAVITSYIDDAQAIVWFYPSNPACRFRAFATLAEGASDYLAMLHQRFSLGWPAVLAGDPRAFVKAIKAQGYFTAPELPYENTVASIFATAMKVEFDMYPRLDPETAARALALVALTLQQESSQLNDTDLAPPPSSDDVA